MKERVIAKNMQLFKVIINEDDEGTLTHGRRHCFQEGLCCVISRESFSSLSKSKHKEGTIERHDWKLNLQM